MLYTELAYFWFSDWRGIEDTNFVTFHGIDLFCFARNYVLFTHMEIYTTVFFHGFVQLTFRICTCQKRRITIRIVASAIRCRLA